MTYPDHNQTTRVEYDYDAMGRLTNVKYDDDTTDEDEAVILAHYDYDELSRRTDVYYNYDGDGTYNETGVDGHMSYDYEDKVAANNDNLGNRLATVTNDINGTDIITVGYTYDKVGNVKERSYNNFSTWDDFVYDFLYQITDITWADSTYTDFHYDNGSGEEYYDEVGNRQYVNDNGTVTAYSTAGNSLNQYDSKGSDSYTYDDNGNLITINTNECVYTYDSQNRLISVVTTSPSHTYSYEYDAQGRRISKTVDSTTTKYAYDGNRVIAEYDGSDNLLRKFIYGPGIDEPICMITYTQGAETARYWYHFDALGSVIALSKYNSTLGYAEIKEQYKYSAFGKTTVTQDGSTGNPYRFTGRRWDDETGLYYYRARMYAPDLGRFLQPDPIGYYDSMNLYQYCLNNPINSIDPYGLIVHPEGTPEQIEAFYKAIEYLSQSQEFRDTYNYLNEPGRDVPVNIIDINCNHHKSGEIYWDPTTAMGFSEGFIFKTKGSQSPAMALAHEMKHAENFFNGERDLSPGPEGFPNMEEYNVVTGFETRLAQLLGEDVRTRYDVDNWFFGVFSYFDYFEIKVSDPTCKGTK